MEIRDINHGNGNGMLCNLRAVVLKRGDSFLERIVFVFVGLYLAFFYRPDF